MPNAYYTQFQPRASIELRINFMDRTAVVTIKPCDRDDSSYKAKMPITTKSMTAMMMMEHSGVQNDRVAAS